MASRVDVKDETTTGRVLGRVVVGDTKLQALERLGRAGAGGLYDREDVGLLDLDRISAEGAPYVFKSLSPSRPGDGGSNSIQERSVVIFEQWSRPLASLPRSEGDLQNAITERLPTSLPNIIPVTGADVPETDVVNTVSEAEISSVVLVPGLESIRSEILSLMYHGTTEDCTHSAVEHLILNTITTLCQYRSCHIQRNRNGVDSSGTTLANLRPDVLVWLPSGVLAFKGEDKAFGVNIREARIDLTQKMAIYSDVYFGEIPYQLAYACAGSQVEFWALMRTTNPHRPRPVQLTPQIDLSTMRGRSVCVRYAANIARVLVCMHQTYPRGSAVRLGSTITTETSTVFLEGTNVIKKTRMYTGDAVVDLYKAISTAQGVPHLIKPVGLPKVSRNGQLTVTLEPVGFCPDAPRNVEEAKAAGRALLTAIRWIHDQGYVHRDIQPSNIMRSDGQWFLIDLEWADLANEPLGNYRPRLHPPECTGSEGTWSQASDM